MNTDNVLNIVPRISEYIQKHHEIYRFPVKGELWEDIFDQVINENSDWSGGHHHVGYDVLGEKDDVRFQNKSAIINFKKRQLSWSGHRTTSYDTIDEKVNFISENHCDFYVMLCRNKKEWESDKKNYYVLIFDSNKVDYSKLDWKENYNKDGKLTSWKGRSDNLKYSANIYRSMSDQLWTKSDLDFLGEIHEINV